MIDKPGDFPIGSPESRAAARAMLEARMKGVRRVQIFTNVALPRQVISKPHATLWTENLDGSLMRSVYIPSGTDDKTKNRLLATL